MDEPVKKTRGRPKGSKNKPKIPTTDVKSIKSPNLSKSTKTNKTTQSADNNKAALDEDTNFSIKQDQDDVVNITYLNETVSYDSNTVTIEGDQVSVFNSINDIVANNTIKISTNNDNEDFRNLISLLNEIISDYQQNICNKLRFNQDTHVSAKPNLTETSDDSITITLYVNQVDLKLSIDNKEQTPKEFFNDYNYFICMFMNSDLKLYNMDVYIKGTKKIDKYFDEIINMLVEFKAFYECSVGFLTYSYYFDFDIRVLTKLKPKVFKYDFNDNLSQDGSFDPKQLGKSFDYAWIKNLEPGKLDGIETMITIQARGIQHISKIANMNPNIKIQLFEDTNFEECHLDYMNDETNKTIVPTIANTYQNGMNLTYSLLAKHIIDPNVWDNQIQQNYRFPFCEDSHDEDNYLDEDNLNDSVDFINYVLPYLFYHK